MGTSVALINLTDIFNWIKSNLHINFISLLRIRSISLFQFRIISEIMNHRHMVGLLG
jgi:hypothetical protein